MLRICMCIVIVLAATACSKHDTRDESVLYGTWVDGSHPADTLRFSRQNNQNIMEIIQSTGQTPYSALEYNYVDGKLGLVLIGAIHPNKVISSFTWKDQNKVFDILGYEIFPLISLPDAHLTYTRVK
jgi:hypothetical protein